MKFPGGSAVRFLLSFAAIVQAVAGATLSGGCLCEPNFVRMGLAVAFGMGAVVVAFALLAAWSRRRPRRAVAIAIAIQGGLLALMGTRAVTAPVSSWAVETLAIVAVAVAAAAAWRSEPRIRA